MARKKIARSEGAIQLACIRLLVKNDYLVLRINSARFGSHRQYNCVKWQIQGEPESSTGTSDILAISPQTGQVVAVEMKRPGEKPTKMQKKFLKLVNSQGGKGIIIESEKQLVEELNLHE